MWEKGQKTKRTYFWLADEDIIEFSEALRQCEALRGMPWQCAYPSPDHMLCHAYTTLIEAVRCAQGAQNPYVNQAHLSLALSGVMFNSFPCKRMVNAKDGYAPDYIFPPEIDVVECGDIAIRWNTQDADDATLALLARQLKAIWAALRQSTLPIKEAQTLNGQMMSLANFRMGRQMEKVVREEKIYLRANGPFCRLVD